jgi:hypothetical protein
MQTYFFQLDFSSESVDVPEGLEHLDLEAVKDEAREVIRELAAEYVKMNQEFRLHGVRIFTDRARSQLQAEVTVAEVLTEVLAFGILAPANQRAN